MGAAVIGLLTVGAGAALYYAWLPANPGPDTSSPPPEAVGLVLGALSGCAVGVAAVTAVLRSIEQVIRSFLVAMSVGSLLWLIGGTGNLIGRGADCVIALIVCSAGAGLGLAIGIAGASVVEASRRQKGARSNAG